MQMIGLVHPVTVIQIKDRDATRCIRSQQQRGMRTEIKRLHTETAIYFFEWKYFFI